jgi:hypothetical protein
MGSTETHGVCLLRNRQQPSIGAGQPARYNLGVKRPLGILRLASILLGAVFILGIGVVWAASYRWYAYAAYTRPDQNGWYILSDIGALYMAQVDAQRPVYVVEPGWQSYIGRKGGEDDITIESMIGTTPQRWRPLRRLDKPAATMWPYRFYVIPYWFFLVFLCPPVFQQVFSWRRRRLRAKSGLCWQCGYDIRATPDRCPECGSLGMRDSVASSIAPE